MANSYFCTSGPARVAGKTLNNPLIYQMKIGVILSCKGDLKENKERINNEISVYQDRINQIDKWKPTIDANLINCLPTIPLSYEPSPKGLEAVEISLYVLNSAPVVLEFSKAFVFLWRKHLFNTLSLPARQIFEMWGAAHYSFRLLNEIDDPDNIGIISININRLMLGARSEVELPWGG
jgi:hypothetical protein